MECRAEGDLTVPRPPRPLRLSTWPSLYPRRLQLSPRPTTGPQHLQVPSPFRIHSLHQSVDQHTQRQGHTFNLHRSAEVSHALESDHTCVITQSAPVYRVARNLRAVKRAAFSEDLRAELGNPTDPTPDQFNTTVLDKYAPGTRRTVSTMELSVVQSSWLQLACSKDRASPNRSMNRASPNRSTVANYCAYRSQKSVQES